MTEEPGLIGGPGTFDRRLVVTATGEDLSQSPAPVINFTVNGVCTDGFATAAFESGETPVIAISSRSVAALPEYLHAPTDPDGDGILEDLNGNGRPDFAEVVAYFNQMQWIASNEPVCAFDLNRNSRIDFADIVALFNEI